MIHKLFFFTLLASLPLLISAQLNIVQIAKDSTLLKPDDNNEVARKFIVDCDTAVFELQERCIQSIESGWIKSITVHKDAEVPEKYRFYKGYDLIIIKPFSHKRQDLWALKNGLCLPKKSLD